MATPKDHIKKLVNQRVLPVGSKRRHFIKRLARKGTVTSKSLTGITYATWIRTAEPLLFGNNDKLNYNPLISIIVPCYNTPQKYLQPLVRSVLEQTYPNWELCLVDASNDAAASQDIAEQNNHDKRIHVIKLETNKGISGNTNEGIKQAKGEFIALLDHDDLLSPHALMEIAVALNTDKKLDLLYSDEDKISDDGKVRQLPLFKPDWSPVLLWGVNYITHFVAVRKSLVKEIGGLRSEFDGAQDYDLLLRLTEKTSKVKHIPKILYHWRLADGSTAKIVSEKDYATTSGKRALSEALQRRKLKAIALEAENRPTNYRPQFLLPKNQPKVSIVIPLKDKIDLLKTCVPSILKSSYQNYEIILVSNNSTEPETFEYLETLKSNERCKVYEWNKPFNYSAVNNFGREQASGDYLVFLNNDTEVLTFTWLEELIGVAAQKDTGAVGPLLLYPNNTVQHAGVVLGMVGMAGHVFRGRIAEEWTDFGLAVWPRNYLAVTGACMAVSTKRFDEVGGFDESIIIAGSDVALCLRLHEAGYQNIYWPFARLYHYESVSVGSYDNGIIGDYNRSLEYYAPYHKSGDPYFNPNLDIMDEYISIGAKHA